MKKRRNNLYWIFLLIVIILAIILIFVFSKKEYVTHGSCPNLTSYKQYKVDPKSVPIISGQGEKCPNGDYAKEKLVREPVQKYPDGPHDDLFVYCEGDKLFWIEVIPAGLNACNDEYKSCIFYYGPFEGEPCLVEKY